MVSEIRSLAKLALPLIASFLAQKGMQFIDTLMMGWIGPQALAAAAIGTAIFITMLVFCMGTLSAVGVFIAREKSSNNDANEIKSIVQNGMILSLLLSIPCMVLIWLSPHFLYTIGEDPVVIQNTKLLLHGLAWGFPGFLLFLVFREFVSAFSLTKIVMFITFTSLPLVFLANYVLIYGKFGLPKLNIAGIGYAGAIINWFMFLCILIYSKNHETLKRYISFSPLKLNLQKIYDILYIGTPSGILLVFESGMFLISSLMMGYFGITALAAYQITLQCASLAYAIPFALGMTTALQVGHAAGARDIALVQRTTKVLLFIGLLVSTLLAFFFVFTPHVLINIYLQPTTLHYADIYQLAKSFLFIAAFFLCLDAVQSIMNGALRGLKDTLIPMLISIACYWLIGIGSGYYLAFHTNLGPSGIWYGLTFGICSAGILLIVRLLKKLKTTPK